MIDLIEILAMAPIAQSGNWLRADQAEPPNPIHTRQIAERRRLTGRDLTARSAVFPRSVRNEMIAIGVTEIGRGNGSVIVATVTATDVALAITSVSVVIERKSASDSIALGAILGEIGMNWTMAGTHAAQ
jgi:hypothetical protein